MAKSAKSAKSAKNKSRQNRQNIYVLGLAALVIGFALGLLTGYLIINAHKNIKVWTVDNTVKMPDGLQGFLYANDSDDCKGYLGTGSPTGVALFAVEKSVGNDYARMAYGCSNSLDASIVAVKHQGGWKLLPPTHYYSNVKSDFNIGDYPFCSQVDKYSISKAAEPKCVSAKGAVRSNTNP